MEKIFPDAAIVTDFYRESSIEMRDHLAIAHVSRPNP